jgi:hypothetical protein
VQQSKATDSKYRSRAGMGHRILAFDLDDTLLSHGGLLPEASVALERASRRALAGGVHPQLGVVCTHVYSTI